MKKTGMDAQVYVPVPNQPRDGLFISQKQLISITYVRQNDNGEHEPLHTLVKEAEIDNSNLNSFASFKELEVYLEKANICINMKEMLEKFKPRLEEHDDQGTQEDHDAKRNETNGPVLNKEEDQGKLEQKAPNPVEEKDIHEVNLEEETPKPLYKEEDDNKINDHEVLKDIEVHEVEALPPSVRLPHDSDAVITSSMKNKKLATSSQMKGKRALCAGNVIYQTKKSELLRNWTIQPRQRSNGKFDKYYYHQTMKIMCRSLVEVNDFEMNGNLPKRGGKAVSKIKEILVNKDMGQDIKAAKPSTYSSQGIEINTPESYDRVTAGTAADLEKDDVCMNKIMPYYDFEVDDQPKIYVETFLNDSFNNLVNTPFSDDPKPTIPSKGSKNRRIEASPEEKCCKATVAAKPIISSTTRNKKTRSKTMAAANDSKSKKAKVDEEYDLDDLQLLDIPITILDRS